MISSTSYLSTFRKTLAIGAGVLCLHSCTSPLALAMMEDEEEYSAGAWGGRIFLCTAER